MKAMVIYDSGFGNTEKIARAIGKALEEKLEVQTLRVTEIPPQPITGVCLLIVGSPTQRFRPTPGTSSFLENLPNGSLRGVKVAAFDTRFTESEIAKVKILKFFVGIFGYAAKPIADQLKRKGGELVVPPEGFYVGDTEGPILEGEMERAADWAGQIMADIGS